MAGLPHSPPVDRPHSARSARSPSDTRTPAALPGAIPESGWRGTDPAARQRFGERPFRVRLMRRSDRRRPAPELALAGVRWSIPRETQLGSHGRVRRRAAVWSRLPQWRRGGKSGCFVGLRKREDLAAQRVDCGLLWFGEDDRRGLTQRQRVAADCGGDCVALRPDRAFADADPLSFDKCSTSSTRARGSSRARWIRWRTDTPSSTHPELAGRSLRPWSAGRDAADPLTLANTTLT
jgi:hypothetical protein